MNDKKPKSVIVGDGIHVIDDLDSPDEISTHNNSMLIEFQSREQLKEAIKSGVIEFSMF